MPSRKVVSGLAVISQKFILYLSELWNISYLSYKSRTSAKNSISEYADTKPRQLYWQDGALLSAWCLMYFINGDSGDSGYIKSPFWSPRFLKCHADFPIKIQPRPQGFLLDDFQNGGSSGESFGKLRLN